MTGKKPRILIASKRHAYTRLFAILPDYELSFVSTFDELQYILEHGQFQLIMIGVDFDESRMFDALHYVRADKTRDSVPILCFRPKTKRFTFGTRGCRFESCRARLELCQFENARCTIFPDSTHMAGQLQRIPWRCVGCERRSS